jgi:FdhD protein
VGLKTYHAYDVLLQNNTAARSENLNLIGEEPLSIRVQGQPYSVVMRTPGDEIAHVAGFCLAEGIIDDKNDIAEMAFCDGDDTNVVTVTLTARRRGQIADMLDRRGYISQTSCGLCGKVMVEELSVAIQPVSAHTRLPLNPALRCLEALATHQPLRQKTFAVHAAALFDADLALISSAEDVGRHNALDKAIGSALLGEKLQQAQLLVLSSRISYELVQKAARARIPIIFAVSRPTALAVQLADALNIALACFAPDSGAYIFCGHERLIV